MQNSRDGGRDGMEVEMEGGRGDGIFTFIAGDIMSVGIQNLVYKKCSHSNSHRVPCE